MTSEWVKIGDVTAIVCSRGRSGRRRESSSPPERTPERLDALLRVLEPASERLGVNARGFVADIAARRRRSGGALLSPRQWEWLERLAAEVAK